MLLPKPALHAISEVLELKQDHLGGGDFEANLGNTVSPCLQMLLSKEVLLLF